MIEQDVKFCESPIAIAVKNLENKKRGMRLTIHLRNTNRNLNVIKQHF